MALVSATEAIAPEMKPTATPTTSAESAATPTKSAASTAKASAAESCIGEVRHQ
jgi:hypothetical protein